MIYSQNGNLPPESRTFGDKVGLPGLFFSRVAALRMKSAGANLSAELLKAPLYLNSLAQKPLMSGTVMAKMASRHISVPRTLHTAGRFAADLLANLQVGVACLRTALIVIWVGYYELLFYLLPLAHNFMLFFLCVGFKMSVCALFSALSISLGLA